MLFTQRHLFENTSEICINGIPEFRHERAAYVLANRQIFYFLVKPLKINASFHTASEFHGAEI